MIYRFRLYKGIFLLFLLFSFSRLLSQNKTAIRFQNLTISDGLSQSSVSSITQDKYGFIWIGTQDGLNRYDGQSFKTFYKNQADSNSLLSNTINCLSYDPVNDYLWIGTNKGLCFYDYNNRTFNHIYCKAENISHLLIDNKGIIWFNSSLDGLFKKSNDSIIKVLDGKFIEMDYYDDSTLLVSSLDAGYKVNLFDSKITNIEEFKGVVDIISDKNSKFLIYKNTLIEYTNNQIIDLTSKFPELKRYELTKVRSLKNRYLWLGTAKNGLILLDKTLREVYNYRNGDHPIYGLADNTINEIFYDHSDVIWIGTRSNGISLFDFVKQNIHYIGENDKNNKGLSSKIVWSVKGSENGNILIGTDKGLDCYNLFSGEIFNYPKIVNSYNEDVRSIYTDKEYTLLGMDQGLVKVNFFGSNANYTNLFQSFRKKIEGDFKIFDIDKYDNDRFLLSTSIGLILFDIKKSTYTTYSTQNSNITDDNIYCSYKSSRNEWWVGTRNGLNKIISLSDKEGLFFKYLPTDDSKSINGEYVLTITEDYKNNLWIGTYDGGINTYNYADSSFTSYTVNNGLSNNAVYGIIPIDSSLWISTNKGISKFSIPYKTFYNYYESDGLQSNEFNAGAYYKTKYDELFFGGINGLSHFYPDDLKKNTTPPILSISSIEVNGKPLSKLDAYKNISVNNLKDIQLDYYNNNISIYLSALHFSNSSKNSYKYFIEEFKDSNIKATSIPLANYNALAPGEYHFVAYASNADGIWNEEPLVLVININPPFWQTWWFRSIGIIILAILIFSFFWFRIQNIRRQKRILESLVKKRTATIIEQKEQIEKQKEEIEKEKEKADNVLHKIFPDRIAQKLKNKGKVKAELYKSTSILFADFVKFSQISRQMPPEELINELNKYFKVFDKIIIRNNLFQIKTIGDSYMAVAGIPKNKTNAIDATIAGLQIQSYMKKVARNNPDAWQVRVGINTGEVVAGVLETKRPLYDVWGSDVNIASRLQDEGMPFKVNVSDKTYNIIKPYFDCTPRGGILTKNVGIISMYYVNNIKPILSYKGEGLVPNKKFKQYLETHKKTKLKYFKLEEDVLAFLRETLPKGLYYHSVQHTVDVIQATEEIALNENIFDERVILLKTAALFHDSGFTKKYQKNEVIGVEIAKQFLPKYGYTEAQILTIEKLILATEISHQPKNKLEKIIKDADLDYIGRDDFEEISNKLFNELQEKEFVKDKAEWDNMQVKFFDSHRYYTNYSIANRLDKKMENLKNINSKLN